MYDCAGGYPCPVCDGEDEFYYEYDDDDVCEICGWDGIESHYHCGECGELCSLMGHWNFDEPDKFDCDPAKREAWKHTNSN